MLQQKPEYILAEDFNRARYNFDIKLPLKPLDNNTPNPFYVARKDNAVAKLEEQLLDSFIDPPTLYFSGHRGCGKSTELRRLALNPDIQKKYWVVHFTIRDVADINDLDYRDVLLAIGSQMYQQYQEDGHKMPEQLLIELNSWYGTLIEEITTSKSRIRGFEIEGGIDALLAKAGLKMKLEPKTRIEVRQLLEKDITGLINVINEISLVIQTKMQKWPLILIDDLDKQTNLTRAKDIFIEKVGQMQQPNCAIVYTVSSALFYSTSFGSDTHAFLPNIKLYNRLSPDVIDEAGYTFMRQYIRRRVSEKLIATEVADRIIHYSGGVFRELARLMRIAFFLARRRGDGQVIMEDAEGAATEARNAYRRGLDATHLLYLRSVRQFNNLHKSEQLGELLQSLALLEYRNGDIWLDVHPVLNKLLDDLTDDVWEMLRGEASVAAAREATIAAAIAKGQDN